MKVRVLVRPKDGILDPQGEVVKNALPALGFSGVEAVHIGRLIELDLESADEIDAMCQRLLANPTIEEYEWEVVG
ncbi:phosphoribosylformylglycinamidine synthase subunit PurS [soil metagenome]